MKENFWSIIIPAMLIFLILITWFNYSRKGAQSLDCDTLTCKDKKGNKIPLEECTKIGLIC